MKPLTEYLQENISNVYQFGMFESLESAGTNFSKIIGKIKEFCAKKIKNY